MADDTAPPVTPEGQEPPATTPPAPQVPEPQIPEEPATGFKVEDVVIPDGEVDLLDPAKAKEFIANTVKSATSKLHEDNFKQTVEHEIATIISKNPDYKPYEDRIRSFVNHPSRSGMIKNGLPIQTVALEAIAPYLERIGAEKARKADADAKATADVGTSRRPTGASGGPDFKNMTPAQIQEVNELVKSGRYQG